MPRVSRRRTIEAPVDEVWKLVSDPYNLPRWWPRTSRVENVDRKDGGRRSQWTQVLETAEGRGVRADYRCLSSATNERYVWEQELEGTPFAKHLKRAEFAVELRADGEATEVELSATQTTRGLSKLGSPMLRNAQTKTLDAALDGIEEALSTKSTSG